jgi:ubiquinone/menaquinone biosynthesis C-methylase UbiE
MLYVSDKLSIKEVENLGYYDFMGYIGVPFFNIGGHASIDRLAEMCRLAPGVKVLEVGCGTGTNACYLAEKYGCIIVGVDIAEHMVAKAAKRADELGLNDRVSFRISDAYDLNFPDASFDAVITVFVSQFLDTAKAYSEFRRVLKPSGRLGINEMYCADAVPPEATAKVNAAVEAFCELTELPFTIRTPSTWSKAFTDAGFTKVTVEQHSNADESPYAENISEIFGGWGKLIATLWRVVVYALRSEKIRKRYVAISSTKKTFLRDKVASKYLGYVLCVGLKK